MRRIVLFALAALLAPAGPAPTAAAAAAADCVAPESLPWRAAGLTERAAAAHLLDRLAYGARPGEVDRVVAMGLEAWVARQLSADLPEEALARDLARYDALQLPARQIAETFPSPGRLLAQARAAGVVPRERPAGAPGVAGVPVGESVAELESATEPSAGEREQRRKVMEWARAQGYRSQRELAGQLLGQKLFRAVEAENQLAERLTDFWFNHLTVSTTDNEARAWIVAYERDAIRPHVLGRFRDLLAASAKHPAMLVYLDNYRSVAAAGQPTTLDRGTPGGGGGARRGGGGRPGGVGGFGGPSGGMRPGGGFAGGFGGGPMAPPSRGRGDRPGRPQGLNENYARELLELHTLGVDGGYSQSDVVEVARAFTGWTVLPLERGGAPEGGRRSGPAGLGGAGGRLAGPRGFVVDGDFLFRADAHDAAAKQVLGRALAAARGIEDGEEVLDHVAAHPATARHLAGKLATRFVADEPPPALVDRLAATFTATGGDLRATMRALVESPEFWSPAARGSKIKSPLELVASALRAVGARVEDPRGAVEWIARMGQPLYASPTPAGFGDRAGDWVGTGSLLARMSFGLELAAGRLPGARVDLAALAAPPSPSASSAPSAPAAPAAPSDHREPESVAALLATYGRLLMPERELDETLARLAPLAADPELTRRLAEREADGEGETSAVDRELAALFGFATGPDRARRDRGWLEVSPRDAAAAAAAAPPSTAGSVAGLLLGSPEFQRR